MKRAPKPAADPARPQAVIYARVSSKEQEKEGFSIPAQLKLLKEYAAANGFVIAQEYVDVETAKQTGRAAFGEMVAYLKAHPAVRVMLVRSSFTTPLPEKRPIHLEAAPVLCALSGLTLRGFWQLFL